jgi:hypothetical protein
MDEDAKGVGDHSGDKLLPADDREDSGKNGGKAAGPPLSRILLLVGSGLFGLVLVGLILFIVRARMSAQAPPPVVDKVKSAITVMRPLPQLDCRAMLDFLIAYKVQGGEMISGLRMEAVFHSQRRYANFKNNTVAFRDNVYNFLLTQNAAENSEQSWHSVLGKNLLDYLRVKLPEFCPDSIRLTQVENR